MTGNKRTSLILGITGGLACGKSEVGRILAEMNFTVCDADHIAHDLMKKGQLVYQEVVNHFGFSILSGDEISRPILGEIIFNNPAERKNLNHIVHPAVRRNLESRILKAQQQNSNVAALVPLLFESEMDTLDWDAIICVESSEHLVLERLERRGLSRKDAELRVASQIPLEQKKEQSDYVIPNRGTLDELKQSTRVAVERIRVKRVL
jgi:dephospho-CoA kinase